MHKMTAFNVLAVHGSVVCAPACLAISSYLKRRLLVWLGVTYV